MKSLMKNLIILLIKHYTILFNKCNILFRPSDLKIISSLWKSNLVKKSLRDELIKYI